MVVIEQPWHELDAVTVTGHRMRRHQMEYAIEATGLVKRFGKTEALGGVDLAARPGTVLGVLGPNGAGKTTAVRILATLLRPDAGSARVNGFDVMRESHRVRQTVGLTGQYASVDEDLTGTQNLVMIGELLNMTNRDAKARAAELLEWFDLTDAAGRVAKTYSGGMRRRLDLAASLVGRPAVIFLDEPTTGLDPAKREDMWGVVRSLVSDGSTVLLTTQYLEEADALADEITVIDHGRVIAHDTPDGLKQVVGGQRLAVRPVDHTRLEDVASILRVVSGTEPEVAARHTLSVAVESDSALTDTVARLGNAGIAVTELSLHLPSLDEVFFTLTGRGTEQRIGAARTDQSPDYPHDPDEDAA
jgi:oleandomycin transport system ATP-binding protein